MNQQPANDETRKDGQSFPFQSHSNKKKETIAVAKTRRYICYKIQHGTKRTKPSRTETPFPSVILALFPRVLKIGVQPEVASAFPGPPAAPHNACLLVLPNSLLEEICLALQADEIHPIERVLGLVRLYKAFWTRMYIARPTRGRQQALRGGNSVRLAIPPAHTHTHTRATNHPLGVTGTACAPYKPSPSYVYRVCYCEWGRKFPQYGVLPLLQQRRQQQQEQLQER